jgi:hypothetical protein
MDDPNQLLVANLIEALQQLQRYVVIGLAASISTLALTSKSAPRDNINVVGISVPLANDTAQAILLAVCILVGAMASYAAESANMIAERLRQSPTLLSAACTFPSVATSPYIGVRILAGLLPFIFSMWAVIRSARAYGTVGLQSILGWLIVLAAAYLPLTLLLIRSACLSN